MINYKKVSRDLSAIRKSIEKKEDIATTRALNILLKEEERRIVKEVAGEYGITQSSARAKIKQKKATRLVKEVALMIASLRANLIKPTPLKGGGISHRRIGGGRSKMRGKIKAGSTKPFMINAKAGGYSGGENIKVAGGNKRVPVYRYGKRIITLKGSSVPHMVEELQIDDKRLEQSILRNFAAVYQKQLEKAKYTGSK